MVEEITSEEYKERYDVLIEKQIMTSIGSRKFGPTYKKRFIEYYKNSSGEIRTYLRSFIFFKVKDYKEKIANEKDEKIKNKLEKELEIYYSLFEDLLKIKGIV